MIMRLAEPMRLALAALALAVSPAAAQTPPDDASAIYVNQTYDHTRSAAADLREAMARAQASNRNILLEVGGDWCSWCHLLDRFIDANPLVKTELGRSFVVVKVNFEPAWPNTRFLSAYPRLTGYPAFIVLGPNGNFLALQDTGQLESGHNYDKGKLTLFALRWRRP